MRLNVPDVVRFTKGKAKDKSRSREVTEVISKDQIMEKIESLSDDRLKEVLDFIEFLEAKKGKESKPMIETAGMEDTDPLANVIGVCEGPPDLAERHDKYVYGFETHRLLTCIMSSRH